MHLDGVEIGASSIPPLERGQLHTGPNVHALWHDHEGTRAHWGDAELLITQFLDRTLRDRRQCPSRAARARHGEERGEWLAQRENHRALVWRFEAVDEGQLVGVG